MFCKICGTENVTQAMFCENCGARLEESASFEDTAEISADYSEPIEEEICEHEDLPHKKSKSVKVLVILIIVLAMLVCGAVGVLLAMNYDGFISLNDNSASTSAESEQGGEDAEEDEKISEEQLECERIVEDVLKAIENETTSVVEENLGFECGDSKALAVKMAKIIADEFDCDYEGLVVDCEKVMQEYFDSMETHIKNSEEVSGEYKITVSFTRLDKEKILNNVLNSGVGGITEKIDEETESDTTVAGEDALAVKLAEQIAEELSEAELVKDEIEFLVANDDGEWFIFTDGSDFEVLEDELTLDE